METSGNAVVARVNMKLLDDANLKRMNQLIDEAATKPGVTAVVLDMSRVQIVPSLGLARSCSCPTSARPASSA